LASLAGAVRSLSLARVTRHSVNYLDGGASGKGQMISLPLYLPSIL
jgi:hypothetical protein